MLERVRIFLVCSIWAIAWYVMSSVCICVASIRAARKNERLPISNHECWQHNSTYKQWSSKQDAHKVFRHLHSHKFQQIAVVKHSELKAPDWCLPASSKDADGEYLWHMDVPAWPIGIDPCDFERCIFWLRCKRNDCRLRRCHKLACNLQPTAILSIWNSSFRRKRTSLRWTVCLYSKNKNCLGRVDRHTCLMPFTGCAEYVHSYTDTVHNCCGIRHISYGLCTFNA